MSNSITEARAYVADLIQVAIPELQVWAYVPEGVTAPAAVINPRSPYLTPGVAMGDKEIALNVRLLLARGDNEVLTTVLDGLIVDVTNALEEEDDRITWLYTNAPALDQESYDTPYLVADIAITINQKEAT